MVDGSGGISFTGLRMCVVGTDRNRTERVMAKWFQRIRLDGATSLLFITHHDKPPVHPFVSWVHICAAPAVFRDLGYLADARFALPDIGSVIHHSHGGALENTWWRVGQRGPAAVCDCHGGEFYHHYHSWNCVGCEIWAKSQGSILLLAVWTGLSLRSCITSFVEMNLLPNRV